MPIRMLICFSVLALMTSCVSRLGKRSGDRNGNGGSILSDVGNIEPSYLDDEAMRYWLKCANGVAVLGKIVEKDDDKFIAFGGEQVREGYTCHLEVRRDGPVDWRVVFIARGEGAEGLYYASNAAKVADRKLAVKIFKTHFIKNPEGFDVSLRGKLPPSTEAATLGELVPNLVCGEGDALSEHAGVLRVLDASAKTVELRFLDLDLELSGQTCTKAGLLSGSTESSDDRAAFEADLEGVILKKDAGELEAGDVLTFPTEDSQFFDFVEVGPIVIDPTPGICMHFDAAESQCRDVREIELGKGEKVVVAVIEGRAEEGRGAEFAAIALFGVDGAEKLESEQLTIEMINNLISDADGQGVRFHRRTEDELTTYKSEDWISDAFLEQRFEGRRLDAFPDGFVALNFADVEQHGFGEISEDELNGKTAAIWFSRLKLEQGDNTVEAIFGGSEPVLRSSSHPAEGGFSSLDRLPQVVADLGTNEKWRVYQLAEMGDGDCSLSLDDMIAGFNGKTLETLEATSEQLELATCEVDSLDLHELTAEQWLERVQREEAKSWLTHYAWRWYRVGGYQVTAE